ncbi:MAG: hypothetical protein ACXQS2_03355 [Methermicoccaceae archaeon]
MGVAKGCPLPENQQPKRCKYCPLPRDERVKVCPWFRGFIHAYGDNHVKREFVAR